MNDDTLDPTQDETTDDALLDPDLYDTSTGFDPAGDYLTDGQYVYQGTQKYPTSVLPPALLPSAAVLLLGAVAYHDAFQSGTQSAQDALQAANPGVHITQATIDETLFANRVNYLAAEINGTLRDTLNGIITRGLSSGATFGQMADQIQQSLSVGSTMPGWRALRIARTEAQWAVNEGTRQQYAAAGINYLDVEPALTACNLCFDLARQNPYTSGDAEGLLPAHPSCRCVWTSADPSELTKHYDEVEKRWVTINGHPVFIDGGDGGGGTGGRGGGGAKNVQYAGQTDAPAGANVAKISGVRTTYVTPDKLTSQGAGEHTRVLQWKQAIRNGTEIPPLVVTHLADGKLDILDGKHRFEALRQLGHLVMPTINAADLGKPRANTRAMQAYDAAVQRANDAMAKQ